MDYTSSLQTFQLMIEASVLEDEITFRTSNITDFYLAAYLHDVVEEDDKDILEDIILDIRQRYLEGFKPIVLQQILKYIKRGRMVQEYDREDLLGTDFSKLHAIMKDSRRSDMKRKNVRWEQLTQHLTDLASQNRDIKKIKFLIDRINNTVHNTGEVMLSKFENGQRLMQIYNMVHEAKIRDLMRLSSNRDLKELAKQYRFLHEQITYMDIGHKDGHVVQPYVLLSDKDDIIYHKKVRLNDPFDKDVMSFHQQMVKKYSTSGIDINGRVDHTKKQISLSPGTNDRSRINFATRVLATDFPDYEIWNMQTKSKISPNQFMSIEECMLEDDPLVALRRSLHTAPPSEKPMIRQAIEKLEQKTQTKSKQGIVSVGPYQVFEKWGRKQFGENIDPDYFHRNSLPSAITEVSKTFIYIIPIKKFYYDEGDVMHVEMEDDINDKTQGKYSPHMASPEYAYGRTGPMDFSGEYSYEDFLNLDIDLSEYDIVASIWHEFIPKNVLKQLMDTMNREFKFNVKHLFVPSHLKS